MNQEIKSRAESGWDLLFRVEDVATDVVLFRNGKEIDHVRIEPNRELLEKILPVIDDFLSRYGLVPGDIADIHVESGLPDGYSSRRIAETVAAVWKWGCDENEDGAENVE